MAALQGVLVTIKEALGSAPRDAGTSMWVGTDHTVGTIGGGNLEFQAIEQARKLLVDPELTEATQKYALGPLLEQCCGGSVVLKLEKMSNEAAFARTKKMIEGQSLTPVYMFGAGHVGRAVFQALLNLPFGLVWTDSRAAEFPDHIPDSVKIHVDTNALSVVQSAPAAAMFLVFTHSHQLDYEITGAVLKRADARYCGLIGSKTKRARFEARFRKEMGLTDAQIARLTCPIGIAGLRGKAPEIIAASVAAQLLLVDSGSEPPLPW